MPDPSDCVRRAESVDSALLDIAPFRRATAVRQSAKCVWLTGLSGAGKSTLARLLEQHLQRQSRRCTVLDGDRLRQGLNRDLGFSADDRRENIRRVAEVARLMVDAGLIAVVALISPFRHDRQLARALFAPGEFLEVFIDTPLEVCERRDVKGLYARARRGELTQFTGIDSPYEAPQQAELHLLAWGQPPEQVARTLIDGLANHGLFG
jgi:bifunctional enzyme CysN/CysC